MAPLILVLGGARSGKSRHAERLIAEHAPPWTYIATAEGIARHRARRDERWQTLEAPHALADAVRQAPASGPLLIDCLTLWLSNRLLAGADLQDEASGLVEVVAGREGPAIIVSNEVGLGIVPDNPLARRFRDAAGIANQMLAARADRVEFVTAGLAVRLK